MKGRNKLLLALAAIILLMLFSTVAMADTLRFGTVDASSVNLRENPSTQSRKIGVYERGTWLRIDGQEGNFYKVKGPDGKTGYMVKDYVYISAGAKGVVGIVDVNGDLNMRSSPSYSGKVIATYPDGIPCILLTENGDWYHVSVEKKNGYFNAGFVDKKYTTYSNEICTVIAANGKGVNLRLGPDTKYGVVRTIPSGSYGMIIQEGDGWWKISVNGYVGYMSTDYLKDGIVRKGNATTGGTTGGNTGSTSGGYALVNNPGANERLNLRAAASRSSRSLGKYGNGTYVTVLSQGNTWCKVIVDGKTGYMMTAYLKFYGLNGSSTATVTHPDRTFVYLRGGPSQQTGKILRKVPHGATVTILTPGATWSQVKYNGQTGYMMTRFLKK
ncbi:MAG: SH3 domain-containing protein [Clostridia bacterium]|nr:SH3 domain-containing protein [Clostridia bacterium]